MPPNGVKTRAQRKKEAAGGAPASPIQMLPLTAPRRAPKRKPTASNATRESTSAATSGSEAENTKETIESQEHTSESTEPETVVESIEKPENINSEAQNSPLVPGISVSQSAPIAAGSPAHRSASPSPSPSRPTQNRNYAVLQLWVNADGDVLNAKRPASQPTVALAVPMEHLANCLRKLAMDYPGAPNAPLLSTSVGTKVPTTEVKKRKAMDDSIDTQPRRRVRFSVQENAHRIVRYKPAPLYDASGMLRLGQPDIAVYSDEEPFPDEGDDKAAQDGETGENLPLTIAIPTSEQVPETPPRSRWGFGSILSTASRFLPGLGHRTAPTTPSIQRPISATPLTVTTPGILRAQHPRTEPRPNTQNVTSQKVTPATEISGKPQRKSKSQKHAQPHKVSKTQNLPPREIRQTKRRNEQAEAILTEVEKRKVKLDRIMQQKRELEESIWEQKRTLEEQQKQIEDDMVREESEAALQKIDEWRAEKKANPGLKRKRPASPKVIPNPKGCSYGFDPRYFVVDSSDEEDESSPIASPTRDRPRKQQRVSSSPSLEGDTTKAQPYTGAFFGDSTPIHQGGNVFGEQAISEVAADKASTFKKAMATTPKVPKTPKSPPKTASGQIITNLSGHFTIPDDDTEDENSELTDSTSPSVNKVVYDDTTATPKAPTAAPSTPTSNQISTQSSAAAVTTSGGFSQLSSAPTPASSAEKAKNPTWSQPPPAPPSPSHATLPSLPTADSDSLNAARAKALKHAPKKPSTLRESSRIISSPLAAADITADQSEAPAATTSATRRASSDEVLAELQNDVAKNPPPPLEQVLGVLAEKAPNGQVKSFSKVAGPSKASLGSAQTASGKPSKTLIRASTRAINLPPAQDRDHTLTNHLGQMVPKWAADVVEDNWTQEDEDAVDLEDDFLAFADEKGLLAYQEEDDLFLEEDLDAAADRVVADFDLWQAQKAS